MRRWVEHSARLLIASYVLISSPKPPVIVVAVRDTHRCVTVNLLFKRWHGHVHIGNPTRISLALGRSLGLWTRVVQTRWQRLARSLNEFPCFPVSVSVPVPVPVSVPAFPCFPVAPRFRPHLHRIKSLASGHAPQEKESDPRDLPLICARVRKAELRNSLLLQLGLIL